MTSRDFCYWLQGYLEISVANEMAASSIDKEQLKVVRRHLALVFKHEIDPSLGGNPAELQGIHDGPKPPTQPFHEQLIRC